MSTSAKREARERALELLYEAEAKETHPASVIEALPLEPVPFAAELACGAADHQELLDHVVGARARGWTVARMPAVDRALLRLATFELTFTPELPTGVAIDEAVELARAFSTDASPAFVNGVLSAVVADVRDDGPWAAAHRPRVLVLDCDGVLRHYDAEALVAAEEAIGMPPGAVSTIALQADLLHRASTGGMTATEWADEVGRLAADAHGVDPAAAAAVWHDSAWGIDDAVASLLREVHGAGVPTACFSNATDRLEADLEAAGVADAFGTIVSSFRLGSAKPDAAFYAAACEAAGVEGHEVLFVDDRRENVVGAIEAGLNAVRFQGPDRLRAVLTRLGLLP